MGQEMMMKDPLTGLNSRAYFDEVLTGEIERARRNVRAFSLMLLDLDHFKSINDAFGHTRGDQVLVEFARRIQDEIRASDWVFRYGGDEFVLLLPETDKTQAALLALRLLDDLQTEPFSGDPPLEITLSIGVANFPIDSDHAGTLFEIADQRHYQAKRAGRARVISEDVVPRRENLSESPSRLIDREKEMQVAHEFLEAMDERSRGVLEVFGQPGYGKTRILETIGNAAMLRGYSLLRLQCTPALKVRPLGVLMETLQEDSDTGVVLEHPKSILQAILEKLKREGKSRMIMVIDNLSDLDESTLDFWSAQFESLDLPHLITLYSTNGPRFRYDSHYNNVVRKKIELAPLSLSGVRIWMRHSLQWEPPQEFLAWFHGETQGIPADIGRGIEFLVDQHLLTPAETGWVIAPGIQETELSIWLAKHKTRGVHNLPAKLTPIFGRNLEIQQLKKLFKRHRIVTMTAPGGFGKSRLALQVAAEIYPEFSEGAYFVPLAGLTRRDLIAAIIADAVRVPLSGPQDPKTQLLGYLKSKQILLVLDTFEHLREERYFVSELLEACPQVKILVTSRESLNLPDELVFELDGLRYPTENGSHNFERYSAVQFFLHKAQIAQENIARSPKEYAVIGRICKLVQGTPLGIELAAKWLPAYSFEQIADQIEENLAFLATDQPGIPERHRSLLAVVDSFWNMLLEPEHRILCRLSVFQGGFREDAAAVVAGASPFFLDALVAKSFLHRAADGRFETHELLRQYSANKLETKPEEETQARDLHSEYYLTFLDDHRKNIRRGKLAREEISGEIDNIREAWFWAASQDKGQRVQKGMRGLSEYYYVNGRYTEGLKTFRVCDDLLAPHLEFSETRKAELSCIYGQVLIEQARFINGKSDYQIAIDIAKKGLEWAETCGAKGPKAVGAFQRGYALWQLARYEEAMQYIHEAYTLADEAGLRQVKADSLRLKGNIDAYREAFDTSKAYFKRTLELYREIGDQWGEGLVLNNLGYIAMEEGRHLEAIKYLSEALPIHEEIGNNSGKVLTVTNLSLVNLGDYQKQIGLLLQALPITRQVGNRRSEGMTFLYLSRYYYDLDEFEIALEHIEQAKNIFSKNGLESNFAHALSIKGQILFSLGKMEDAYACYWASLQIGKKLDLIHILVRAYEGLARAAVHDDVMETAKEYVEEILRLIEKQPIKQSANPFRIHLMCYQVLAYFEDPRARPLLEKANKNLLEQAQNISPEALRESFLKNISDHRTLLEEAERAGLGQSGKRPI